MESHAATEIQGVILVLVGRGIVLVSRRFPHADSVEKRCTRIAALLRPNHPLEAALPFHDPRLCVRRLYIVFDSAGNGLVRTLWVSRRTVVGPYRADTDIPSDQS